MATLSIPNTFVAGTTVVAADMNANFTAVSTLLNTTKLDHENLNYAYQDVVIGPFHIGATLNNSSSAIVFKPKISTGTLTPVQVTVACVTMAHASASITVDISRNPANLTSITTDTILNSAIVYPYSSAGQVVTSTNFRAASSSDFSDGNTMMFLVKETGSQNVSNISVTLQCVLKHRASP